MPLIFQLPRATAFWYIPPRPLLPAPVNPVLVDEARPSRGSPFDMLAERWRSAPRRWGHPLHRICSYFAMFPPQVPRVFIEWLTRPGDVVYDPFSGRGTAPMEAVRLGRVGLGSDANPLAYVLTAAKLDPPEPADVTARLDDLRRSVPKRRAAVEPDIEMLYTPLVTRQLLCLRQELRLENSIDRFIMAAVLGLMHANYKPGSPARGLSISMPNTFSMSPGYVRRYIDEHDLKPPKVDVFDMVERKLDRLALPGRPCSCGRAWEADATKPQVIGEGRARLVFTSPPYLGVISYGKYNWIRLWMLEKDPRAVDAALTATSSLRRYLAFMSEVLHGLASIVVEDGYVCLMIGDVRDRETGAISNLAETVWLHAAQRLGWRRLAIVNDPVPIEHKVSRIWGHERSGNATKIDRILILAPPNTKHDLPALPRRGFDWSSYPSWAKTIGENA